MTPPVKPVPWLAQWLENELRPATDATRVARSGPSLPRVPDYPRIGAAPAAMSPGMREAIEKQGRMDRFAQRMEGVQAVLENLPSPVGDVASAGAAVREGMKGNLADAGMYAAAALPLVPAIASASKGAEKIVAAAIREPKTGRVFTGGMHVDVMDKLPHDFDWSNYPPEAEGFVTNTGRFVSREEAGQIALAAKQVGEPHLRGTGGKLVSENVDMPGPSRGRRGVLGSMEDDLQRELGYDHRPAPSAPLQPADQAQWIYHPNGQRALITRDPRQPGQWRLTRFDASGTNPLGHRVGDSPEAMLRAADEDGFNLSHRPYGALLEDEAELLDALENPQHLEDFPFTEADVAERNRLRGVERALATTPPNTTPIPGQEPRPGQVIEYHGGKDGSTIRYAKVVDFDAKNGLVQIEAPNFPGHGKGERGMIPVEQVGRVEPPGWNPFMGDMSPAEYRASQQPNPGLPGPSRGGNIPPQVPLNHYVGLRTPAEKLQEAYERSRKAFGPKGLFGKLAAEGEKVPGAPDWYDTRELVESAAEANPATGADQANEILNMMAGSTAMSRPNNNLKRGILWSTLNRRGLLDADELRNNVLYPVPEGFGHMAQRKAHQKGVAAVVEHGGLNPIDNPKPASFGGAGPFATGNLGMNWQPATIDEVMSNLAREIDPKLGQFFSGGAPKGTYYGALSRGLEDAAKDAHKAGRVPLVDDRLAPTAPWQAMGWMGRSGSAQQGSFMDIYRNMRKQAAAQWGVTEKEAERLLFQEQRPFLLPLDHPLGGR